MHKVIVGRHFFDLNMGGLDRLIRILLGFIFVGQVLFAATWVWSFYAVFVGIIFLTTALCSWDPIYAIFGINTHRRHVREIVAASDQRQLNANVCYTTQSVVMPLHKKAG